MFEPFALRDGDDPHGVLSIDLDDVARAHSDDALAAAVRDLAAARDPELSELGADPDAALDRRAREFREWWAYELIRGLGGPRRTEVPEPEPPTRAERLWHAVRIKCDETQARAEKAERQQRERADRLYACCPSLRDRDIALFLSGDLRPTLARRRVKQWWGALGSPEMPRVLVLLGDPGVGKTIAATDWLMWLRRARGRTSSEYVRARDLASHFTASYGGPDDLFKRLLRVEHLVVDEAGQERTPSAVQRSADMFFELLEARARSPYATVIISNRSKLHPQPERGFIGHYTGVGDAVNAPLLDRLRSDTVIVELAGESLRPGAL